MSAIDFPFAASVNYPAETTYTLAPDVVLLPVEDGSARLLDLGGSFYAVSTIGADMLRGTLEQGVTATVRQIARRYAVDHETVRSDVQAFVRDLVERGLLRVGARPSQPRRVVPSLVLGPALRFLHRCLRPGKAKSAALLTLAWLSFRLFGWANTIAVWQACHRPRTVPAAEEQWQATVEAVDESVRLAAASHPLTMECKERAVCCWSLARAAGVPAVLVVGLQLCPLGGHCWCEAGPWTLSDNRDRCDLFQPVITYA